MIASAGTAQSRWEMSTVVLLALLVTALGLRIWGIWFGLPHVFHNDEGFEIIRALQLGTGDFDFTRVSKGGYFYLLFVEYGVLFLVLLATGVVSSPTEFGEYYVADPSAFYLIGRATTAVIGALTVYMVYRIGRLSYTTMAALAGAGLLTFNVLHSYLSHLTTVDIPMTFLSMVALYFAAKMVIDGNDRDYWWAALMAALATTTKIPAILVLVPLIIAHCYYVAHRGGTLRQYFFSKNLWQAAGIFIVVYVITAPGIIFYFDEVLSMGLGKFTGSAALATDTGAAEVAEDAFGPTLATGNNLFVYYFDIIVESMTWPVFVLCVAGLAYAAWKHRPVDVLLVSYTAVTYLALSSTNDVHHYFPRYIAPILPVLALLGGRLLTDVVALLPAPRRAAAAGVAVALLVAMPAVDIASANHALLKVDTRAIAREWFDANIPPGSKVFIEGSRTVVSNATIPLQNSRENIRESVKFYEDEAPGRAKYFRMQLKVLSGSTYDLVGVQPHELRDLKYYKDLGVQYFVLRPAKYAGSRLSGHWPEFVSAIQADPDIELLKRFEPGEENALRSPLIEIYRVKSNVDREPLQASQANSGKM